MFENEKDARFADVPTPFFFDLLEALLPRQFLSFHGKYLAAQFNPVFFCGYDNDARVTDEMGERYSKY